MKTGIYKHFKGGTVLVIGLSKSSDGEERVLYIGQQDKTFHDRPLKNFCDIVDFNEQKVERFKLITPIEITTLDILNLSSKENLQKN